MTGFDASAHAAEETVGASRNVPRGIVRSVLVPALMILIGDANWKLPAWLDRTIPRLNVEGSGSSGGHATRPPESHGQPEPATS